MKKIIVVFNFILLSTFLQAQHNFEVNIGVASSYHLIPKDKEYLNLKILPQGYFPYLHVYKQTTAISKSANFKYSFLIKPSKRIFLHFGYSAFSYDERREECGCFGCYALNYREITSKYTSLGVGFQRDYDRRENFGFFYANSIQILKNYSNNHNYALKKYAFSTKNQFGIYHQVNSKLQMKYSPFIEMGIVNFTTREEEEDRYFPYKIGLEIGFSFGK